MPALAAEGCIHCLGATAPLAWAAIDGKATHTFIHEVHFTVHATRCQCGQPFIVVFTERVNFHDGEDTQVELAVSVSPDELAQVGAARHDVAGTLTHLVQRRRFLARGTGLEPRWVDEGFAIGPHG